MTSLAINSPQPVSLCDRAFAVKRYTADRKQEWDAFIQRARNGTFLFYRDYMDYHADRFVDHSLMLYRHGRLAAVLPANLAADGIVASHDGLTYGGLVVQPEIALSETISCVHQVTRVLHFAGVKILRYKSFPLYYSQAPGEDLSYCLFMLGARLYRRDCSLVVPLDHTPQFQKRRIRQAKKAALAGCAIKQDVDFQPFWHGVLIPRLVERYGVRPVHTLAEITLLASRFPQNIKQFSVYDGAEILAGITVYETDSVAHAQYIASTERGRKLGALDFLVHGLLSTRYNDKRYFDFGGSNEQQGRALNHGLLEWKEGFGARTLALDQYEIQTANYVQLTGAMPGEYHRPDRQARNGGTGAVSIAA